MSSLLPAFTPRAARKRINAVIDLSKVRTHHDAPSAFPELELIHPQRTQQPRLRAEGECACVAQMARAKIRGRGGPSASQRERHLWVVSTLEMHTGRRLTCGTRSSIIAEVKNGFSAHRAPSALPPGKCPSRARTPSSAFRVTVKRGGPKNRHHASGPLVA